jgi:hypothetical protein
MIVPNLHRARAEEKSLATCGSIDWKGGSIDVTSQTIRLWNLLRANSRPAVELILMTYDFSSQLDTRSCWQSSRELDL